MTTNTGIDIIKDRRKMEWKMERNLGMKWKISTVEWK